VIVMDCADDARGCFESSFSSFGDSMTEAHVMTYLEGLRRKIAARSELYQRIATSWAESIDELFPENTYPHDVDLNALVERFLEGELLGDDGLPSNRRGYKNTRKVGILLP
jgi:hypothetical protein